MLRDWGADIVKIEMPIYGDQSRSLPVGPDDHRSGYYLACNRGKRGVTLDPAIAADPGVWDNGYLARSPSGQDVVGTPVRFSDTPAQPGWEAPELGQNTEEVLIEAGYSWDDLDQLRQDGAI